ncbi:class I SAM-dependent methyltransferase [Candidatus Woesebacteria bacterium]|nr:class I SAM-dependent methyltransferase [Candidatus Woesebacteria bacterium]
MAKRITNTQSLEFFRDMASQKPKQYDVKINPGNDHSDIDAKFILEHTNRDTKILDLGSGSGLIVNKIYKQVSQITAIDAYKEFTKYIKKAKSITIVNEDISLFTTKEQFDLVTMFGIVQYFSRREILKIYKKYVNNLKPSGKLIIKNQFGIDGDVIVSGYSKELTKNYYSHYRRLPSEVELLKSVGLKNIRSFDIYPAKYNRWKNTHFYAILGEV